MFVDHFGQQRNELVAAGFWEREITPVTTPDGTVVTKDDGPRAGVTYDAIAGLDPVFRRFHQGGGHAAFYRELEEEIGVKPELVEIIESRAGYRYAFVSNSDNLGATPDAHVAQVILRELASHADVDGQTGMSLGILHEYEADEEILDRYRFAELWPAARRTARHAGMGS